MNIISAADLTRFIYNIFIAAGFPHETATVGAHTLVRADLKGIDSHGLARLSGYIRLVKAGRINVNAKPKIIRETPSTATLDGDSGLGLWVGRLAMEIAMEKAEKAGSGWVAVRNSSHFGIAAAHAELALAKDMIGFSMTNASPLVAPAGAQEAYLGTNPICVAVPAGNYSPFIADLATSAVANGKLEIAQRKSKPIPEGWAQTASGGATTDANALKNGGTLLPLGSDVAHGYHKGYALGATVDILTGVLSGANFGRWVPPFVAFLGVQQHLVGEGIGHFLGAWRIDAFEEADVFKSRMDQWIEGVKALTPAEGISQVLIPGEPEHFEEAIRSREGIPINDKVWEDAMRLGEEMRVKLS